MACYFGSGGAFVTLGVPGTGFRVFKLRVLSRKFKGGLGSRVLKLRVCGFEAQGL